MANRNSNMYKGQYEWIIKGNELTQMIKADNGQRFTSQTFKMCSLDWCIGACPNGNSENNVGAFDVFLKLLALPQSQQGNKIIICRRIYCKELDSSHTFITEYKKDDSKGWADYTLSLNEVRNHNMKQISFIIEIRILRIMNESSFGTKIIYENDIYFDKSFNKQSFNWIIDAKLIQKMKNSLNGKRFESPIYNKMWCLKIAPNGYKTTRKDYFDVILRICAFPQNISKISVRFQINCKEMQINTDWTNDFDINGCTGWLWSDGTENVFSFTDFKNYNLNAIEFEVNVNILSIYDNNGKKINNNEWNKYIKENDEKKECENIILESLVTRMDEISSQIKSLTNIITNIQQNQQQQQQKNEQRFANLEQNANKQKQINKLIENKESTTYTMDCIANSPFKHIVNNTELSEHYNAIIAKLNHPFIYCWVVSDGIVDAQRYDLRFNLYIKHIGNLYEYKFHTTHKQIKYLHDNAYTGKDSRFHFAQMAFPRPTNPQRIQRKHRGLDQQMGLMDDLLVIKPEIQTLASFDNQIDGNYQCTAPGRKYLRANFWNSEQNKATQRDNDAMSHFLCQLLNSASFAVKSKELFTKCNIKDCVSQIIKLKATSMLQILCSLAVENIFYDKDRHLHEKLLTNKWKDVRFHTLSVVTRPAHGNKFSFNDHWALKFEGVKWLLTVEWLGSATFFVKFLPNNCLGQKVFWFSWTKKSTQTFTQRWGSLKKINISQGITAEYICKLLNKWLVFCDGQEYKSKYDQMRNNCQHFVRDFVCFLNKKFGEELTKEFHHRRVEKIMTPFGASSDDYDQYPRMDKVRKFLSK